MTSLPFKTSRALTMGVELELQLLNRRNYNLATDAVDLLEGISSADLKEQIKLEITQGMIELNSSIHTRADELVDELKALRDAIVGAAQRLNIDVAGGGAHPFQHWGDQRITPSQRFHHLHDRYGYLAKTFTVFGQHIHIGVESGDDAIYLTHALACFVPHFIALSASSPFYQGMDTGFDSSRSNVVSAFPLAGTLPPITRWTDFEAYYDELLQMEIIASIKDFYWDIRPKPEYGTVEIRVCDTPLSIEHAGLLAGYAQLLARWILNERPISVDERHYLLYRHNRFEASRFGYEGEIATLPKAGLAPTDSKWMLRLDILERLQNLERYTQSDVERYVLRRLRQMVYEHVNDASWLRESYRRHETLSEMMRQASMLWMEHTASPYFH
ncbi:MAG: glutamate--cysteine ligase [Burkholderiaceae bacterium]|nr:glutamate--cysteine ligase [Burkholderiaceae bacterium]